MSMKLTPSSTTRRSVSLACARSGGSPQMPLPVTRIAPKPIRRTTRSPPISMVPAAAALAGLVMVTLLTSAAAVAYSCCDNRTVTDRRKLPGGEWRREHES